MAKVMITGSRGFIGSYLRERIQAIGIDVREGNNLLTATLPKADIIYHLAAQTSVENSWNDPVHDMDNLRMVARLVKEYPLARIIYTNSAAARPPFSSPYGFSKWACAEYLKAFHKDYVICTLPNVYGKGSRSVVDAFRGKSVVEVYGDGRQTRDYVHVQDIVDGLIRAQEWPVGEYELGSGVSTSVLDLALGKDITFLPTRKEARESVIRNTTPDWKPTVNVYEYLSKN